MKHSKCKRCKDLLFDFASNLTEQEESQWMKAHLRECSVCHKEYEETLQMIHLLKSVDEPELPSGFQLKLHQKLVEAANEKTKGSFLESLRDFVAGGYWKTVAPSLVCLVLVIGVFSSGLYKDWKNGDEMLTQGTIPETVTEAVAPETTAEKKEDKVISTPNTDKKNSEKADVLLQSKMEQEKKEDSSFEQETKTEDRIDMASEPIGSAYGMRDATQEPSEGIYEQQNEGTQAVTTPEPLVIADEETEEAQTVAMSTYRVSLQESVVLYLEACQKATGIDWNTKADFLNEDGALLILTDYEWEIFSEYLKSTGTVPQIVHDGDAGIAVRIQR